MKRIYKYKFILLVSLLFVACDVLDDKKDLTAINSTDVWNDEDLSLGFLNEIYQGALWRTGWPVNASATSDDATGTGGAIYGELTSNAVNIYSGTYTRIKNINVLLANIGTGTLDVAFQESLKSQALFLRALLYFDLVSTYGGVPLVLELNQRGDENLDKPRNSTSECIAQILNDLDMAIDGLPNSYADANDYGRITKGAAMAFKGKVLLHYASEQFDPNQSASGRWQDAYNALTDARTNLANNGKGLHPSFADLWFDETSSNTEAIFIRKYTIDQSHNRDAGCRPFIVGTNGESWDKATLSLVDAFPMKDGKAITDGTSAYTYDSDVFWTNRDPRLTATIAYNGDNWPINDAEPYKSSALHWSFQESPVEAQAVGRVSQTSFYCKKAIDVSIEGGGPTLNSPTDWIEMRFADLLLMIAEAANEIGSTSEAYDILEQIRQRAGIDVGDGSYGLAAGMTQSQMRDAIMLERRLEFAFEGKRSEDLRRRRMYNTINGSIRRGYVIERTAAFDALDPSDQLLDDRKVLEQEVLAGNIDLNDPTVYNTYFTTQIRSVERDGNLTDDGTPINYLDQYYFFDLPQIALDRNPNLQQTEGWDGGTFNPLD